MKLRQLASERGFFASLFLRVWGMLLTHEIRFFSFLTDTNEVLMMSMMRLNNIVVLVRKFTNSQVDNQHKFAVVLNLGVGLSNGHSPANLANSSTRQKFALFLWLAPANLSSIERIFVTRAGKFVEYWANLANLANLASLANLARVD